MPPVSTLPVSAGPAQVVDPPNAGGVRYSELDTVRGVAIVAMIAYHAYVVSSWAGAIHASSAPSAWLQRPIPILFVLASGVSFSILSRRASRSDRPYRTLLRPVARVAGAAGLVSLATYLVAGDAFVRFGILHAIAACWVLAAPLRKSRVGMVCLAAAILLAKAILGTPQVWSPWWAWAGFPYPGFVTMDYFPLLPWFGVFLLGVVAGDAVYRDRGRPSWLQPAAEYLDRRPGRVLAFAGRHALAIYLAHIPVIYGLARGWVYFNQ